MRLTFKESSIAFLFLMLTFCSPFSHGVTVNEQLSQEPYWAYLLHLKNEQPLIRDPNFFISSGYATPNAELQAAYAELVTANNKALQCRFPARYKWLLEKTTSEKPVFSHCAALNNFLLNVPHEKISLVFSSENLTSPSSMMGHILIKISGNDSLGHSRNHAVSFFTLLNSINVPKIIFDSLVTGKDGIFLVSPYSEKLNFYLHDEGRNVWEYELDLTDDQKTTMLLHIWELKNIKLDYYFDDYNCATLTQQLLAIAEPEKTILEPSNATPLDVIKKSDQSGLIKNVTVITAPQWRARMLKDSLTSQELNTVIDALANADMTEVLNQKQPQKRYLMTELIDEYNSILYRKKKYTEETYQRIWQQVQNVKTLEDNKYKIDLTEYKNPIKSPPDSQWAIGVNREEGETHLAFSYMPASHDIYDDNRQYFGENELKLAAFTVQANESKIFVEEFTLYGIQSIIPRDPILGGISGKMNVGYYRQYNKALEKKGTFRFQAGLGVSSEPIRSVSMFAFLTAGAGYGENTAYASLSPEVGLIVREANNFKSHISVKYDWNQFNSGKGIYSFQLKQAKYIGNNIGLFVAAGHHLSGNESAYELSIVVKRYF